jgi:hypothetical protein
MRNYRRNTHKNIEKCIEDHVPSHPKEDGPPNRANRCIKGEITKDQTLEPPVMPPTKGGARRTHLGVSRPKGSAEPRRDPVTLRFGGKDSASFGTSVINVSLYSSLENGTRNSI